MLPTVAKSLAVVCAMSLTHSLTLCQQQTPLVTIPIVVTDGVARATLLFGIDPGASDSLDVKFGESELPPFPPSEVFDARFVGFDIGIPLGLGTLKDFRAGTPGTAGQRIHELMFQIAVGRTITVQWNLPAGTNAVLQDVYVGSIINVNMKDSASYTVLNPSIFNRLKITVDYAWAAEVVTEEPLKFTLFQNYPNPFNPSTTIGFEVGGGDIGSGVGGRGPSWILLSVYDMQGREVAVLVNGKKGPGEYTVPFCGSMLGSGVYYYRLQANGFVASRPMVLVR